MPPQKNLVDICFVRLKRTDAGGSLPILKEICSTQVSNIDPNKSATSDGGVVGQFHRGPSHAFTLACFSCQTTAGIVQLQKLWLSTDEILIVESWQILQDGGCTLVGFCVSLGKISNLNS